MSEADAPDFLLTHPLGESHEHRLLEDLRAIAASPASRGVIRLHLSRLQPNNRDKKALLAAETAFDELTRTRSARLYRLRNSDLMVMFEVHESGTIEKCVMKLLRLWGADPLLVKFKLDPHKNRLASWFDLSTEYGKLVEFAQRQVGDEGIVKKSLEELVAEHETHRASRERGQPMTPLGLARAEESLARVDLSSFTRRQPVCAFVEDGKTEVVFTEVFVSIGDLRETLMPGTDFLANPWLFQRLTQTLDKRVMAQIGRRDDRSLLREGFSVNLNVATLLSEEFLEFDENFTQGAGEVVLELRLEDIFSDLPSYIFARDFVHERGYRICLDGLTTNTFYYADTNRLQAGFAKLSWSTDMAAMIGTPRADEFKALIRERRKGRVILARCDSDAAVRVGQQLGITLFQGRYIDSLRRERY
ncbi:MAG: EAL domain-containing protein [Rhodobacteraceae bacterium]|nr:EAL domain-containing protein [Paracoccaceae bacterium]